MWDFYTVSLQIHSGNCLQKIGILDHSLIKLLQNEQGCKFFASQCKSVQGLLRYGEAYHHSSLAWDIALTTVYAVWVGSTTGGASD